MAHYMVDVVPNDELNLPGFGRVKGFVRATTKDGRFTWINLVLENGGGEIPEEDLRNSPEALAVLEEAVPRLNEEFIQLFNRAAERVQHSW